MATLQDYLGITALRDAWPKWKANVIAINNQVINHVAGTADKHAAQDITYTGDFTGKTDVKAAIDQAKTEIDTIVVNASIDPEVAFARDSAVKSKTFTTLDDRLEEDEQDLVSYKAVTMNGVLNVVSMYDANKTGVEDVSGKINQAILDGFSMGEGQFPTIYLPPGIFTIGSPILHNQAGNYCRIVGSGIKQTIIRATSSMSAMLVLSDIVGFHGRKMVEGITFDGNDLANCGIDGSKLRYSTVRDNEFVYMASGGYALKMGNWVNRVTENNINGLSKAGVVNSNGINIVNSTVNNFVVDKNSITSCNIGMRIDSSTNDLSVTKNTFDNCPGTGMLFTVGGRKLSLLDNYIEACGKDGVQVEVANGVFETWYGAVVGNSLGDSFENLSIKHNQFANCSEDAIITLGNISSLHVEDNHALRQYSSNYFVNLKSLGSLYTRSKKVIIDHVSYGNQFNQLVGLNGTDSRYHHSNLEIHDRSSVGDVQTKNKGFELNNLLNWDGELWDSAIEEGLMDRIFPITKVTTTTSLKTLTIDVSESNGIRGEYFNANVLAKGDATNINGLRLYVKVDGITILDTSYSSSVFENSFRNSTFYIPLNASTVEFLVRVVNREVPVWFTKFNISNANIPNSAKRYNRKDL